MYTSSTFADMQHKTMLWHEDKDCCVKAMAIALDIRYAHAWRICRLHGRPFKEGMYFGEFLKAFNCDVCHNGAGYSTNRMTYNGSLHDFIRKYNAGTYIIDTAWEDQKHTHVYKNGVMHDAPANWLGAITDVYEIVKNG